MKKFFAIMVCALAVTLLCGCGPTQLEKSAVEVVNSIVANNLGPIYGTDNLAKCTSVDLDEEVSEGVWTGKAYFDNGKEIACTVKDTGDQIYVEIDFSTLR